MKFLLLIIPLLLQAITFKIASYNVENLFDLHFSGNEYVEYIPDGKYGWNRYIYQKKIDNISKVIYDLKADIISLEEVESLNALLDLRKSLKRRGLFYRYYAIADKKDSTVKVAVLSRFKITKEKELKVAYANRYRDILEVHIDINGYPLILFANHWKSKSGPESERVRYAKALKKRIAIIPKSLPYIILGDFNSNYNEYITFLKDSRLNDTYGKTGINHILKTIINDKMVTVNDVKKDCTLLYNLWLELPEALRYSYIYHGEKDTIDNILLPCSMFDKNGIEYIKNSFNVFKPSYLFKKGSIYRWQRRGGYGKFTGDGYSDHLPIYAFFTTDEKHPEFSKEKEIKYQKISISSLYDKKKLYSTLLIKDAAIIYKDKSGVIAKKDNDRAIYIYRHNKIFKKGYYYDIYVNKIKTYQQNKEIVSIKDATKLGKIKNINKYYLHYRKGMDLSRKIYQNEVIYKLNGIYKKRYLYYAKGKKIRLYSKIKRFYLHDGAKLSVKKARIMWYKNEPEIVIYYKYQIKF